MALFSERNGFVKPREIFQIDSLDERTKNRIWNWILENFINKITLKMYTNYIELNCSHTLKHIFAMSMENPLMILVFLHWTQSHHISKLDCFQVPFGNFLTLLN